MQLQNNNKLHCIQTLRFLAALSVVILHAGLTARRYSVLAPESRIAPYTDVGHFGVALFFVISGFIMVLTAYNTAEQRGAAKTFLLKRLIRIAPLYWLVTAAFVIAKLIYPPLFQTFELQPWHTLASFLFLPATNNVGELTPVVNIGWTLNYEMFFYLWFALGLAVSARALILIISIVFPLLVLLGLVAGRSDVLLQFCTHPYLLFFVIGFWVALLYRWHRTPTLGLFAFTLLWGFGVWWHYSLSSTLLHVVGLGPLLGVLCWAGATGRFGRSPGWLSRLGDSSYSLYLTHTTVLTVAGKLWHGSALDYTLGPDLFILLMLPICVLVGHLVYLWIEWPLISWLRARIK